MQLCSLHLKYSRAQEEIFFPAPGQLPKFTVVTKGRRQGLTRGAAQAYIEYGLSLPADPENGIEREFWFLPDTELTFLWGDTINGNIRKYVERYFMPILRQIPRKYWKWNSTDKVLRIGRATIDFRSADNPENWEGFGYNMIFLNEAGIILENASLYENSVLPMLMDFEDSRLIAAGVPKGKRTKEGLHKFFELWEEAGKDKAGKLYRRMQYNSYQNPFISHEAVDMIASVMDEMTERQEIFGEFVDLNEKPYFYVFKEEKHTIPYYKPNRALPLLISFDFNVEPCTAVVAQKPTHNSLIIFDEIQVSPGSTEEVVEEIMAKYPEFLDYLDVTGDATGQNGTAMIKGNVNHYKIIREMLNLPDEAILVPTVNPSHKNSRLLCNSVFAKLHVRIAENCENTVNDCIFSAVDDRGELIKTQQEGRHFFDNVRYLIHAAFPGYFDEPGQYLD